MSSSLLFFLLAVLLKEVRPDHASTQVFTKKNLGGSSVYIDTYQNNLNSLDFNDKIDSTYQYGIWIYYKHYDYDNSKVVTVAGIGAYNFPRRMRNEISSLRYVGDNSCFSCHTFTVYQDEWFGRDQFYGSQDASSLGSLSNQVSSVIITGSIPWTLYEGPDFTGSSACIYPHSGSFWDANGHAVDFGWFPKIRKEGVDNDNVESIRHGCWSRRVLQGVKANVTLDQETGALLYSLSDDISA